MRTVFGAWSSMAALLVAALFTLTISDTPAAATSFGVTGGFEVADTSAGVNSDVTFDFDFDAPDALFTGQISFLPPEWGIGSCPANDAGAASPDCAGNDIEVGQILAENDSNSVLGLLNGPCLTQVPFHFDLVNATLETSETVVFHDTDIDGIGEMFEDNDENGIPDGADHWPEFITRLIRSQPFPGGDPLEPILRLYGQFNLSGTFVGLQYVVLEPGSTVNGTPLDPSLGFPIVLLLQDIGDPGAEREPDPLTDFCSPLESSLTLFGVSPGSIVPAAAGGAVIGLTNPADGGYNLVSFVASEYDDDGDGIPNPLDSCATQGNNAGWDPRVPNPAGDSDGDGLPDICDPEDAQDLDQDQDDDGWVNRGDNCPLTANVDQSDLDRDSIGDACDETPIEPSLHQHFVCIIEEVDIGAGGDPASDANGVMPCALRVIFGILRGNVDCSEDGVTPIDALHILRFDAGLWPAAPCIDGGDVNCDGERNVIDTLQVLRFEAGLEVTQNDPCTPIGTLILIIE